MQYRPSLFKFSFVMLTMHVIHAGSQTKHKHRFALHLSIPPLEPSCWPVQKCLQRIAQVEAVLVEAVLTEAVLAEAVLAEAVLAEAVLAEAVLVLAVGPEAVLSLEVDQVVVAL